MSNLSIKDVPEAWAESLRQRAARNHRSLQGELMAIIEQAVREGAAPTASPGASPAARDAALGTSSGTIAGYDRYGHPIIRQGWKTIEQISAEMAVKYSVPVEGVPLAVDIIREERDAR